ncbi:amidohydrolase family protein [Streptomyces sp. S6]
MSDRSGLVDAHHHLWDLGHRPQPWLDEPGLAPIRRTFGLDDLTRSASRAILGHRLTTSVLVQCLPSVPETRELLALADGSPSVGAVVGWVDLTSPAVADTLDELRGGPGGDRLRSVRHLVQGESDPHWLQRPDVERGLRAVQERGLGYDVLVRDRQLPQAVRLAQRFPGLPLVLDHAGKPDLRGGDLIDWTRRIRELAAFPQVRCKLSGLVTEADHEKWTTDDIRPVRDTLLDAFGPERLMFGSDWPVCVLAGGWDRWAETVEELLAPCTGPETSAILAGTATDFYRLAEEPPCS